MDVAFGTMLDGKLDDWAKVKLGAKSNENKIRKEIVKIFFLIYFIIHQKKGLEMRY